MWPDRALSHELVNRAKAAGYYAKLMELAKKGGSNRPELARARAYVAQR